MLPGLEEIYQLLRNGDHELRIDMITTFGTHIYAKYRLVLLICNFVIFKWARIGIWSVRTFTKSQMKILMSTNLTFDQNLFRNSPKNEKILSIFSMKEPFDYRLFMFRIFFLSVLLINFLRVCTCCFLGAYNYCGLVRQLNTYLNSVSAQGICRVFIRLLEAQSLVFEF